MSAGSILVGATGPTGVAYGRNAYPGEGGFRSPSVYVKLSNATGGTVYLANTTGVTGPSNGYPLPISTSIDVWLYSSDTLYAVTASGNSTLSYLISGE